MNSEQYPAHADQTPSRTTGPRAFAGIGEFLRRGAAPPSPAAERWAVVAFGVLVAVALPVIFVQGNDQWFFLDEWVFLAGRDFSWSGLVEPHNEHLVLVPVAVFRAVYRLVGINAYWPYQAVLVAAHITSAILLRVVMRRSGVGPWTATLTAGVLLLFGSGRQDIVWAFQISFTGALALGLVQLLLSDTEHPAVWRQMLGVVCGVLAVATSSVGVIMVGVVGLAAVLRGRWPTALVQVLPPAVVWTWWWWVYARDSYGEAAGPRGALEYAFQGFRHALAGLSRSDGAAVILVAAVGIGLALALRGRPLRDAVADLALAVALFAGGLGFITVTGFARAGRTGNDVPEATRYVYLVAGLALPLLACALQNLAERARWLAAVPGAILLLGVPGNANELRAQGFEEFTLGREEVVLVGASLPELDKIPEDQRVFGLFEGPLTAGWLRNGIAEGRVPSPPDVSAVDESTIGLEVVTDFRRVPDAPIRCPPLEGETSVQLKRGEVVAFQGGPLMVQLVRDGTLSDPVAFDPASGQSIEAVVDVVDLVIAPVRDAKVQACHPE